MKAIIFAAGLGTRLRPLTDNCPKALIDVGGKTSLQRAIEHIKSVGINDIFINVHYISGAIIEYLTKNQNFGLNITISDESDRLLDTGGGLLKIIADNHLSDDLMLYNSDIITDFDLQEMVDTYATHKPDALLLAYNRASSRQLLFSESNVMRGWCNLSTGAVLPEGLIPDNLLNKAFGGIHIISPKLYNQLFDYKKIKGDIFSITPFYIEKCSDFAIKAFTPKKPFKWFDIGKLATLQKARESFKS